MFLYLLQPSSAPRGRRFAGSLAPSLFLSLLLTARSCSLVQAAGNVGRNLLGFLGEHRMLNYRNGPMFLSAR